MVHPRSLVQQGLMALIVVLLPFFVACNPVPGRGAPAIEAGVLDLRNWDFNRQALVELNGQWGFIPAKLLYEFPDLPKGSWRRVPDLWQGLDGGSPDGQGYGTYYLTILLPPWFDQGAIRYRTVSTSFQLQAGDKTIAHAGYPSPSANLAIPAYQPGFATFKAESGKVKLLMRVSNWHYRSGGLWRAPSLGLIPAVQRDKTISDFTAIIVGTALISTGLSMLLIYLFRRKESYYLYFAFFTLVMTVRTLVTGEYLAQTLLPGIPFEILVKLEYLTMVLSLFCCIAIFIHFFPVKLSKAKLHGMFWLFVPYLTLIIWSPLPVLTRSPFYFYICAFVVVTLIFTKVLIPSLRNRVQGSGLMLAGSTVLAISAFNDALHASFIIHTEFSMTFALVIFVIMQMTAMTARFTRAIDRTELLASELTLANERLRDEIVGSVKKQELLEDLVHEKDLLVREVHHRVKNSLQLVSSVLVLQSNRSSDSRIKTLLQTLRMRIQAISLVHEKLYGHVPTGSIFLKDYVVGMVDQLATGFGIRKNDLDTGFPDQDIEVGIDFAIDLGLIMTELVSNACKYSQITGSPYPEPIHIGLGHSDEAVWLLVEDKGPGFPSDFDQTSTNTLGHLMVRTLLRRSRGTMEILPGPGGRVRVTMPLEAFKES